jgi:hypothetical protein
MSAAFIVDPPGASADDRVFVIELWGRNLFQPNFEGLLTINGQSWPATERLQARVGQPEHWRVLNASRIPHPMHLHGFYFDVDAVSDGDSEQRYSEEQRRMVVTETVMGGHTFDILDARARRELAVPLSHLQSHDDICEPQSLGTRRTSRPYGARIRRRG